MTDPTSPRLVLLSDGRPLPADAIVDRRLLDTARELAEFVVDHRCPEHGNAAELLLDVADLTLAVSGCCPDFHAEVTRRIGEHAARRKSRT